MIYSESECTRFLDLHENGMLLMLSWFAEESERLGGRAITFRGGECARFGNLDCTKIKKKKVSS